MSNDIFYDLEPDDEYNHTPGPETNFNESMYFNVYDPTNNVGGFFRIGNRVNEGYAEVTICCYLPDGSAAFFYNKPSITTNEVFNAGSMTFSVVEPFRHQQITYNGEAMLLSDPTLLDDPKTAYTTTPRVPAVVTLDWRGTSDMFGGKPKNDHHSIGNQFASAHYEQLGQVTGTIQIGDQQWDINGFGLRDHSWGPRFWQAPWYYRWLTANFGPDLGFMLSRVAAKDSEGTRTGFIWRNQQLHLCTTVEIATEWSARNEQEHVRATLHAQENDGTPFALSVTGEVLNMVPLRNRRDGMTTRIAEGLTKWTLSDGTVGYGWSEYLDQIIDGEPVGKNE